MSKISNTGLSLLFCMYSSVAYGANFNPCNDKLNRERAEAALLQVQRFNQKFPISGLVNIEAENCSETETVTATST